VGYERSSLLPNIPINTSCASNILPSCPDLSGQTILIVATLSHRPNIEGIDRFITRIWPHVRKIHPRALLRIVGSYMQAEDQNRWERAPGVRVIGFVEDLRSEYAQCAFTVCPVFIGGGSKIKVLESLANGRTAVISAHSHRGYEDALRHLDALWVAEDDNQFVLGCIRLLEEADLRDNLAKQGHFLVSEKFSFQRAEAAVSQALEDVFKRFPEGVQNRSSAEAQQKRGVAYAVGRPRRALATQRR
jgi:glycosyltransferase involved in cell wall biosynthesis